MCLRDSILAIIMPSCLNRTAFNVTPFSHGLHVVGCGDHRSLSHAALVAVRITPNFSSQSYARISSQRAAEVNNLLIVIV